MFNISSKLQNHNLIDIEDSLLTDLQKHHLKKYNLYHKNNYKNVSVFIHLNFLIS